MRFSVLLFLLLVNLQVFSFELPDTHTRRFKSCKKQLELSHELIATDPTYYVWFPSCDEDGSFAPVQCYRETCWCSLGTGEVIVGTETIGIPDCGEEQIELEDDEDNEDEVILRCKEHAKRSEELLLQGVPGVFVPQCTNSGDYRALQCDNDSGYCWCCEWDGKIIDDEIFTNDINNDLTSDSSNDFSSDSTNVALNLKRCEDNRKLPLRCQEEKHFKTIVQDINYTPLCDNEGALSVIQCDSLYCYCVNTTDGRPFVETRVFASHRESLDCAPCHSISTTSPRWKCSPQGTYESRQCNDRRCWCMSRYGTAIPGSIHESISDIDCDSPCSVERLTLSVAGLPSRELPSCTSEGLYSVLQCKGEGRKVCWIITPDGTRVPMTRFIKEP